MSLYPTLEDLKVHKIHQAQHTTLTATAPVPSAPPAYPETGAVQLASSNAPGHERTASPYAALCPSIKDYMGLELAAYRNQFEPSQTVAVRPSFIAPVSGSGIQGIKRSVIKPGISEVILCKDHKGLVGLRLKEINKGCFVQLVTKESAAALGGIRFGDQILSINDELVAGYSTDKIHKVIKKCPANDIRMAIRERPFERTVTLTKDSGGITGFAFRSGKIDSIIKDSSAARNGLLIDHQLVEVNGQNVIALKDTQVKDIMSDGDVVTLTIMPIFVFDHMMKNMGKSLLKSMDHSVPEC